MIHLDLEPNKYIYFASDNHLGIPDRVSSLTREKHFVNWLDTVKVNAQAVFILGDLFDFWFEYDRVVPKHFVRIMGKLAELTDSGILVYYFVGNHDLWMKDYFQEELSIPVYYKPQTFSINSKIFLLGHGDGLGPGDLSYKRMKKIFTHPISKFLFKWIHPDIGMRLGHYLSAKNKLISGKEEAKFLGEDKESLVQYCKQCLQEVHYDFFVFGHRHLPIEMPLGEGSKYVNLGDWIKYFSYATFDGKDLRLDYFKP